MTDGNQTSAKITSLPDRAERPAEGVTDPQSPPYRIPPHNLEAEQALLGAILVNNGAYERVSEFLQKDHFADPVNGRIYEACGKLIERGQMANPITLKNFFDQDGSLADVGGAQYLVKLAASVVTVVNAEDYGRTVYDLYLRRQLIDFGETVVNEAFKHDLDATAESQIEAAEGRLFGLAETGRSERGFQTFSKAMADSIEMAASAYRREGGLAGVPSGFTELDKMLGGLHYSDLLILAGRPAMGKTALATNVAFHAATRTLEQDDRYVVAFFSLEMSAEQLATRILAEQTGIPSEKIRKGELNDQDFQKLVQATQRLERTPLFIDDTPALPVSSLRTRARRLKRQHGLHLIVVDYLQLLQGPAGGRAENRVNEISEITRNLKAIAKELHVPVIALSQLSRAVEQREDKRPQLADLRESGSIEQDADVVMFVFREEYYLGRAEPVRRPDEGDEKFHDRHEHWKSLCESAYGKAEVIIGKQRHGPTGKITLRFDGNTTKFSNYVADDHLPDTY